MSVNEIWDKALVLIKEEISDLSYKTWFLPIKPISIVDNKFYINVIDQFNKGPLERYETLIKNSLNIITSKDYEICFCSPEDNICKQIEEKKQSVNTSSSSHLNDKYVFDEFIVGNSNKFAHAAAVSIAENPAQKFNPFFLYGNSGLGKTHLMQAIGHHIINQNKNAKVVYISSEQFTNEMIESIKSGNQETFRNKYRYADVLLVDDIQFIGGKEGTQEEFFHTFNALHSSNKQIVISSDRPPHEISTLEDRLRSRFEWGITTDIQPPDYETRIAILRKKAEKDKINIPDEVFEFIAKNIQSNIRELEGALNKINAYAELLDQKISLSLSQEAIKDIICENDKKEITIDLIKQTVTSYYNLKTNDLDSKKRPKNIVRPRHIAMFLCCEMTDESLSKIGESFGGRDHTTIMSARDNIRKEINKDNKLNNEIEKIKKELKN